MDSLSGESLIGEELGPYRIEERLGAGGMGEVYRALHLDLHRPVAVKILRPEVAADRSSLERFFAEARAANLIRHENIVECTDMHKAGPGALSYIVMELLEGRTLTRAIRDSGRLSPERAVYIAAQVADALEAAHHTGIIHRDLKPDNVFLIRRMGNEDYVKVLDFGVARLRPELTGVEMTQSGVIIGTPAYMSPEQCQGQKVTPASDIYSLGVLLFQMLTGQLPFDGPTMPMLLVAHMMTEAPRVHSLAPDVPEALSALVAQSLSKLPGDRPPSMAALRAALLEAVGMEDLVAAAAPPRPAAPSPATSPGSRAVSRPPTGPTMLGRPSPPRPHTGPPGAGVPGAEPTAELRGGPGRRAAAPATGSPAARAQTASAPADALDESVAFGTRSLTDEPLSTGPGRHPRPVTPAPTPAPPARKAPEPGHARDDRDASDADDARGDRGGDARPVATGRRRLVAGGIAAIVTFAGVVAAVWLLRDPTGADHPSAAGDPGSTVLASAIDAPAPGDGPALRRRLDELTAAHREPGAPAGCQTDEPALLARLVRVARLLEGGAPDAGRDQDIEAVRVLGEAPHTAAEHWHWLAKARLYADADVAAVTEAAGRAIGACGDYAAARNVLGSALFRDRPAEAEAAYARALAIAPDFAGARLNLGLIQLQQGRIDDAVASLTEIIEGRAGPDASALLAEALLARGQAHLLARRTAPAIADLERAVDASPGNASAHFLLGQARALANQPEAAREAMCQARALGHPRATEHCPP